MPALDLTDWRELISRSFAPLRITSADPDFRASLTEVSLDEIHLFDMTTGAHRVERSPDLIDPQAPQFCKLSLQMSGTAQLHQDGRTCRLHPGDLALYVTQRPYTLDFPGRQHSLVVHFPQRAVNIDPELIREITATGISRRAGLGKVAVPLFEQLARNLDVLSGPHALSLVHSALDMLVTVLSSSRHQGEGDSLFRRAVQHIDENLADPQLSPQRIADHLYVSLRQLHARFAAQGVTVAAYIRSRRLLSIRQQLADPLLARDPVLSIGGRCGMPDASHLSKAFKAEFGESPSAYRARVLG